MGNFNCAKCGVCCQNLDKNKIYNQLDRGDGTCIHFNETTKECSIYDYRPDICNVDKMYDIYFKESFSKEDYYSLNHQACRMLK